MVCLSQTQMLTFARAALPAMHGDISHQRVALQSILIHVHNVVHVFLCCMAKFWQPRLGRLIYFYVHGWLVKSDLAHSRGAFSSCLYSTYRNFWESQFLFAVAFDVALLHFILTPSKCWSFWRLCGWAITSEGDIYCGCSLYDCSHSSVQCSFVFVLQQ